MFKKMTAVTTALAISIMLAACGGDKDAARTEPPGARAAPAAEARAETNARTPGQGEIPAPTRPQRLNISPTEEPSGTGNAAETRTAPAGNPGGDQRENPNTGKAPATAERAAAAGSEPAAAEPAATAAPILPKAATRAPRARSGDTSPAGLIPDDPETNDEVLLQDIYALMDLDQFALDPNEAIPLPYRDHMSCCVFREQWKSKELRKDHPPTLFDYKEVRDHPYLHLFPGLKGYVEGFWNMEAAGRGLPFEREFQYHATRNPDSINFIGNWNLPGKRFTHLGGITHFIYHPWFEPVEYRELKEGTTLVSTQTPLDRYQRAEGDTIKFVVMPHWFGANSTRGVIADAVARALEQARRPGVEEHPAPTFNIAHGRRHGEKAVYGGNRDLASHLRTPIETMYGDDLPGDMNTRAYRMPFVQWEFLHPSLPIIKVTSFVARTLPLANPGEEPRTTAFAVSFVISFQNRWTSFEDPNRWLIRFKGKIERNQELHERMFPRYWHTSDYMQHRLIGPVMVQVYEHEKQGPGVIEPGVYAVEPRVSHWEAPGPILKDEHILVAPLVVGGRGNITGEKKIVRNAPQGSYPNPGWPLPGHVMTNPATGPGTKIWKDAGLDWHDW